HDPALDLAVDRDPEELVLAGPPLLPAAGGGRAEPRPLALRADRTLSPATSSGESTIPCSARSRSEVSAQERPSRRRRRSRSTPVGPPRREAAEGRPLPPTWIRHSRSRFTSTTDRKVGKELRPFQRPRIR